MEHSIAIYKVVYNNNGDYKSELQFVIRTSPCVNMLKCFEVNSVNNGHPLKSIYITNKNAFHFICPDLNDFDDEYFMVISTIQNYAFPIHTNWCNDANFSINDFNNCSIVKFITPNTEFWNDLWNFLNMEF